MSEFYDHASFQIIGRDGLKQMHEAAEAALHAQPPDPKRMWDEMREEKASTLKSSIEFDIGTPRYEDEMNERFHDRVGHYITESKMNDAGWRIDDLEEPEEEVALADYTDSNSFIWKRIWAKLYAGIGAEAPSWEEERRFKMETLKEIRARVQIGNMMTCYKLLGKPYVFYIGSGGKGSYAPATHPEDVVKYEASPLKSLFPVHRRDGNPILDSLGAEIKTYTAEEAFIEYYEWLSDKLAKKDKRVRDEICKMAAALMKYKKLVLVCWCHPLSTNLPVCHGEIIADKVTRTVFHHLEQKGPMVTEKGVCCWACGHEIEVMPFHEVRCHHCGASLAWDLPEVAVDLELEPEEVTPAVPLDLTVTEHVQSLAELDYEINTLKRIQQYLKDTHHEAMVHSVQPGAIDLRAHDQAWKIWKDEQAVTNKLEELYAQLIVHASFLSQQS